MKKISIITLSFITLLLSLTSFNAYAFQHDDVTIYGVQYLNIGVGSTSEYTLFELSYNHNSTNKSLSDILLYQLNNLGLNKKQIINLGYNMSYVYQEIGIPVTSFDYQSLLIYDLAGTVYLYGINYLGTATLIQPYYTSSDTYDLRLVTEINTYNYEAINYGYSQGYQSGYDKGFNDSKTVHTEQGYINGQTQGEIIGYQTGYEQGKIDGHAIGLADNTNNIGLIGFIPSIIGAITAFLFTLGGFEVFGISIISIISIIAIISLAIIMIKVFKGG